MVIRTVERATSAWPTQLADLGPTEPDRLWVDGTVDLRPSALRSVAIVGCRNASAYGRAVAHSLAGRLAEHDWVVVSGAAFGIDAAAHRGALDAGGPTVAVLPGGVDVPVPRAHEELLSSIRAGGAVVAENVPGTLPRRHSFLIRNRLIAALTRAVLVVEADMRSGALNTARQAESMGRIVMAIPGPITGGQSRGTHTFIRDRRAELVTNIEDVLELIEPIGSLRPTFGSTGRDSFGSTELDSGAPVAIQTEIFPIVGSDQQHPVEQ